jgi:hypothetical protein
MVPAAAEAFYRLHLAVAADLAIIVDLSAIDPELGVSLDAGGRLLVPAEPAHGPAPDLLAWHRARFFERLGR